jgi:hypothetical protein
VIKVATCKSTSRIELKCRVSEELEEKVGFEKEE